MKTEQLIHTIGTSVGMAVIYELKCLSAARKERRKAPGYDYRTEFGYRFAYRLGKLWARRKKSRSRTLS